jgi:hypothetical protein
MINGKTATESALLFFGEMLQKEFRIPLKALTVVGAVCWHFQS